ncbi:hypothetical protein PNIG_a1226 [Pseudoalteromonas nigrifaciens]|uniref:Uncharacterized protein n=1 Tax=Pseudoalteromonas nigrifaciens TaxID=28109 RepID=A0AAC9XWZ1_9GAMM|nr:hypothetical protein PNIG_a1226 [Pseudoalteromonas nigrifaciens]
MGYDLSCLTLILFCSIQLRYYNFGAMFLNHNKNSYLYLFKPFEGVL